MLLQSKTGDNLDTRQLLNKVSYKNNKALVSGAAMRMEGQIFCTSPSNQSSCYACLSHLIEEPQASCAELCVMSPLVDIIGSMQALNTIKILTNYGDASHNKICLFDAMTGSWQTFKVLPRKAYEICAIKQKNED